MFTVTSENGIQYIYIYIYMNYYNLLYHIFNIIIY